MRRTFFAGSVICGLCCANCLLVSSFDRFDADAPDLSLADVIVTPIPGDASGPFTVRVETPAVIDGPTPASIVVHITRTTPVPLRVRMSLPQGTTVLPASQVGVDATTNEVSFTVDVSVGPRGKVKGAVRVETLDGLAAQTADVEYTVAGPGDLDPTFGVNGVVVVPVRGSLTPSVAGLALDDDAAVLGGHIAPSSSVGIWTLARVSPSGADAAFGVGGVVEDDVGPGSSRSHHVAMLSDQIWASGSANAVLVRRYARTGQFIGSTTVAVGGHLTLLAPADEGMWVVYFGGSGSTQETSVSKLDGTGASTLPPQRNSMSLPSSDVYIDPFTSGTDGPGDVRVVGTRLVQAVPIYDRRSPYPRPARIVAYATTGASAGMLDGTFGNAGLADEPAGRTDEMRMAFGVVPRADGSLVFVGGTSSKATYFNGTDNRMLVGAMSKDGVHDGAMPNALSACQGVLFHGQADAAGRVVLAGYYGQAKLGAAHALALVRLRADGTVDPTFGSPATGTTGCAPMPGAASAGFGAFVSTDARRVAIDAKGRILVAGRATRTKADSTAEHFWFVARFRP